MKHFALMLEAESPLAIRSDHAATGVGSTGYIAGSALAGSLASAHRFFYPTKDACFQDLFLSGKVRYPDLSPAAFESKTIDEKQALPVYPLPRTARTCKRFPGFRPIGDEDPPQDGHGARDTLLDWAVFSLRKRVLSPDEATAQAALLEPLKRLKTCSHNGCEQMLHHFRGYYRRVGDHLGEADLEPRLQTHTGINRDTGTVQEGILYHRRVFQEGARFWGQMSVTDDLAQVVTNFITEVGETGLVRVGTSRTRGMGKVRLHIEPLETGTDRFEQFKERLRLFSRRLREEAGPYVPAGTLPRFAFALTLHSPLILCDDLLRYRGRVDEPALAGLLGLPADVVSPGSFDLLYQAADTRRVSGWNDLWGTPRTNEIAIDTGSVFLFTCNVDPDEVKPANALWQALFQLEEEGAGRRRAEGFGRIVVSDQFHMEGDLL